MKSSFKLLFLLLMATGASYAMDRSWELEVLYTSCFNDFCRPIQFFVNDFKHWSKEEQDKIEIINNKEFVGYLVKDEPIAAHKYNGGICSYLDYHLKNEQLGQFIWAIHYLKKQKEIALISQSQKL